MADTPRSEKTEQPTPRRRREALERGQVPRSRELAGVVAIALFAWSFAGLARGEWGSALTQLVVSPLQDRAIWTGGHLEEVTLATALRGARLGLTPLAITFGAVAVALLLQGRPVFTLKPFEPDPTRLDPVKNLGKALDPKKALGNIAWSHVKLALIVGATGWGLKSSAAGLLATGEVDAALLPAHVGTLLGPALKGLLGGALAVALVDQARAMWTHEADLRMTRKEIKDEHQQSEGDPLIKARMRALMREHSRRRMLADVRTAALVVTNPTHYAVALRYTAGSDAVPVVVARGKGHLAKRIREEAAKWGVTIVRSPALARSLHAEVGLGSPIPETHYAAVAAILVDVLRDAAARTRQ